MLAKFAVLDDDRGSENGWIKPMVAQAAPPGSEDQRIARRVAAFGNASQFPDVLDMSDGYGTFLLFRYV